MRRLFLYFALAAAMPSQSFRTGPVYTANFPDLDLVIESVPPVTDAASLTLLEDGQATANGAGLRRFRETGNGVTVALAIDVSGSMRGRPMQSVREGLSGFVSQARDFDQIAVSSFADDVRWEADWTTPRARLKLQLENIEARGKLTRLWDAVDASLTMLESDTLPARRHLVVISDGHDEGSRLSFLQVIAHAQRLRIPVDCIGITRSNPAYLRLLERLSQETRGTYRTAAGTDSLKDHISNGIQRLLDTPVATFRAVLVRGDGLAHDIGARWDPQSLSDQERITLPKVETPPARRWLFPALGGGAALALVAYFLFRRPRRTGALPPPGPPVPLPYIPSPRNWPQETTTLENLPPPIPAPVTRKKTEFASPQRSATSLVGISGPVAGWRIAIDRDEFWIGAETNNNCRLELDETVSGNHACFRFEGATLRVYDNHSTNKTWVNGQPLGDSACLLYSGDQIRIGKSTFILETES